MWYFAQAQRTNIALLHLGLNECPHAAALHSGALTASLNTYIQQDVAVDDTANVPLVSVCL